MLLMTILTAVTNLNGIPGTIFAFRVNEYHRLFIGVMVVITSFMYHFCESIGMEVLFLDEG